MKLEVPIINEDGSVKFTQTVDEKQVQILLQFALNFLVATGMAAAYGFSQGEDPAQSLAQMDLPFSD